MKFELGLGAGVQPVEVPDKNILAVLTPNPVAHALGGEAEVRRALENPIGSPRLNEIVKPGETVAIITSEKTIKLNIAIVIPVRPRAAPG